MTCETSYGLDSFVLVTGPWTVQTEEIDGVSCRTFLSEANRPHAEMLMASLREEIPRYQKLLGPVPDGRFDVVSNFFTTGYGFPNFTLLGEQVIGYVSAKSARTGQKTLPSGYIDHELVHCWLGNYVQVDYDKGNWCEALTTWFTNYGSTVRDGTDVEYRKKVSRKFSLRVFGERDYPLKNFKSKRQDFENDIGYGKGSMVFHMLERDIGRQTLIDAVRHVVATRGGQALGWDAMIEALSEGAGRDLAPWFKPWLEQRGAPIIRFGSLRVQGNTITGTILQTQDGPAFPLRVPVRIEGRDGVEERIVEVASKETAFRLELRQEPVRLLLDPDHHLFRRVARDEVAPCLEAVLTAPNRVGFGDETLLRRLQIPSGEAALPKEKAVLLFGVPDALRKEVFAGARRQAKGFKVDDATFSLDGVTYDQPGDGILLTYRRPGAPPVSFFHGNAEAAFERPRRYLPYYAAHGWVVFRNGQPIRRGEFEGDEGTRRRAHAGRVDSIVSDLLHVTDDKWKGRRAGTGESYKLANELRGRLFQTGATILPWPGVLVPGGHVLERPWIVIDDQRTNEGMYAFHWSGNASKGIDCAAVAAYPAKTTQGRLVVMDETATYEQMKSLAENGAAAIVVRASEETFKLRGKEATWKGLLPRSVSAKGRNIDTMVSGLMARTANQEPLSIPVIYAASSVADALGRAKGAVKIGVSLRRTSQATANLVGVFGPPKKRGILLTAHWDGLGMIGDRPSQGAADNAAGVAVVLWVASQLKADADAGRLSLPVVVALFGAEEAGLIGSRQFAAALTHAKCPIAKPLKMINVDAIGGGKDRSIYVIGRSHHAELFDALAPPLRKAGFTIGRDIDKFAFPLGSDHWPLPSGGRSGGDAVRDELQDDEYARRYEGAGGRELFARCRAGGVSDDPGDGEIALSHEPCFRYRVSGCAANR